MSWTVARNYMPGVPDLSSSDDKRSLMIALAQDGTRFSAYYAIVNCDPYDEDARAIQADRVIRSGSKLAYPQAASYFPSLDADSYNA